MELNIFEINQKLTNKDYELQTAKEKLLNKENSLWLETDWIISKKKRASPPKPNVKPIYKTVRRHYGKESHYYDWNVTT